MKKAIVFGIAVLFMGLAIIPSINANDSIIPVKNKLVETAVRIYNSRGITPFTLKLSEKQSDEVDRIFDALKVSLDSAETGEEIDTIYDDAVESLYKLGLFPRMTLKEAKQLVNGKNSQSCNVGTLNDNFDCKVAGQTSHCLMFYPGRLFMGGLLLSYILDFLRMIDGMGWYSDYNFPYFNGRIGEISFGAFEYFNHYYDYYPSYGWVHSNGSNGIVKWKGPLYGNRGNILVDEWERYDYASFKFMGMLMFEGLFIDTPSEHPCFLGNAAHISLTNNKPPKPPYPW